MLNLTKLMHFRAVALAGSFERACQTLHLTQPSLSRSIQSLERDLGTRLLDRQRGRPGVRLTESGRRLLAGCEELLAAADDLEGRVSQQPHREQRSTAFGIGPMLASTSLMQTLLDVINDHPELHISVMIDTAVSMQRALQDGDIEFYIAPFHPRGVAPGIVRERLGSRPARMLVRPGHPLLGVADPSADDIAAYPRVSGTAWNEVLRFEDPTVRRQLGATVEIDNFEILVRIALSSDAVLMYAPADRAERLIPLPTELPEMHSPELSVFSLAHRPLSPIATRLADGVRRSYVERGGPPSA